MDHAHNTDPSVGMCSIFDGCSDDIIVRNWSDGS